MKTAADFAVHDPVRFRHAGSWLAGHLAKKAPKNAFVVSSDGTEYRVPWHLLVRDANGRRKRVRLRSDLFKAQFRPDDKVMFAQRSGILHGIVARLGPKRAVVVTDDEKEFVVPYARLRPSGTRGSRNDERRFAEVEREAERLLARYGLEGWSFQYDDAGRRAGVCWHGLKVIALARLYCIHSTDQQVRDTILHEIAHALVGPEHNHDAVWKAAARSIGCTGDRCHYVDFAPPRYIMSCPRCRWAQRENFRRRGTICKTCRTPVKYKIYTRKAWESAQASRSG